MTERLNVLILGYGEMGHAMEYLIADNHNLYIWDLFPPAGFQSVVLEQAAPVADIVLFCLPVIPHREVIERLRPMLKPSCTCLSIAKGLDEQGQTAAQVFQSVLGDKNPYVLLYGPMISEEIRAGRYAFAQLGCHNKEQYEKVSKLFATSRLYIQETRDITGISWSVILKNVYAMIFGMADELQLGDNMRGYLSVAALQELDEIVRVMGGDPGSPFHLAGLGDLITTATSDDSHHHELGRMLARGEIEGIRGEGVHTLAMVKKYQLFDYDNYPLFNLISGIIERPQKVKERIDIYLEQVF